MAEGRTKAYYQSDILTVFDDSGAGVKAQFQVDVPNNLFAQAAALGWAGPDATKPTGLKLPKRCTPRHVVGTTPTGKRVRAIVATTAANLWATPGGTWTFVDNSGATINATVTGLVGEKATL